VSAHGPLRLNLRLDLFELSIGLDQLCLTLRKLRFRLLKARFGLCQCHLVVSRIWLGNGLCLFDQLVVVHQELGSCFRNPPNQRFFPFVGGLVFDALVVGSLISALIRLEFCSAVPFVERFQATANGKSPMCIIIIEALRRKCGLQNYLVLAGAVRNAYQPGKGD